jgi:hypothetical protein
MTYFKKKNATPQKGHFSNFRHKTPSKEEAAQKKEK